MTQVGKDTLMMVAVVAAMALAGLLFVYRPAQQKLDALNGQIEAVQESLASDGQKAQMVPELARQIDAMRAKYKDFDRRLPKQRELGGFLREISENLASEKITNQVIEPASPVQQELFYTLPIVMRFRGSYLSMASFLQHIDQMERLTRVQKLQVTLDPKDNTLQVLLYMNIYFTES